MALREVLQGLQRLTLTSASRLSQSHTTTRLLHTSPICCRVLNRRLYPINREPSANGTWEERKPMRELYPKYTIRPLPFPNNGSKGPNGRMWNYKRGGGAKKRFRMLDEHRCAPDQSEPKQEVVKNIVYDPNRSSRLALVAGGEHKRYIIATVNMKVGDVITSSRELFDSPVRAAEGDAYSLGSLAIGSIVNSVEMYPGEGGTRVRAAGVQAQIVRRTAEHVILRLPSKYEVAVLPECMATVGRVGNSEHNQKVIGKAGRNRWKGIRPKSGYYQKKTGRFGRKIRTQKEVQVYKQPIKKKDIMARLAWEFVPESRKKAGRIHY